MGPKKDTKADAGGLKPAPATTAVAPAEPTAKKRPRVAVNDEMLDYYAIMRWADEGGRWVEDG